MIANCQQLDFQVRFSKMQELKDPARDRVVKHLPLPPHRPLTAELLFISNNQIDWVLLKDHLKKEGKIAQAELIKILDMFSAIVKNEGNMLHVSDPVTIVGDIHGQYYDFLKILDVGGNPQTTKYLFLGDYVDRGAFSIEVLLLLFSLKINFPKTISILRGNHECKQMTSFFNFRRECLNKYNQDIYDRIMACFNLLPIACLLNGKFFCVHGGLSPDLKTIEEVKKIDRFKEIPKNGVFCDLMWADPVESTDGACETLCKPNDVRGCSYFFGAEMAKKFLEKNKLISVIRAHEAQIQGFKMYKWNGFNKFPTVITIFSAPNYCDVYNNKGAVIKFVNNTLNIQQFNYTQHPYLLPNFLDVFSWSIPFVSEKVTQMFYHILRPDQSIPESASSTFEFTDKVKFIEALLNMQKSQKQKNMNLIKLDGMCPDDKLIESGIGANIKEMSHSTKGNNQAFVKNKEIDLVNEKRPADQKS